ncbi:hypothetical protein [Aestuariivirga litoralis]|uniref:hypothetical protein n=1 Tax=Aestuariivirga litoralis TaxID=2650924 RepID=UPI0018C73B5A|nr:hypothetical protein [Aestuariivirga litoralis]MBG1233584.1 hypothetical protein [Aestuariivirga litoralis]
MKAFNEALNEVNGIEGYGGAVLSPLNQNPNIRKLDHLSTVIVRKYTSGFEVENIREFADALEEALDEHSKFLVFDFAHHSDLSNARQGSSGFSELIHTCANLIINSPTITVAWARGPIAGADLEFALSCSMIAAEAPAVFLPTPHGTAYAFLARKIGLSRAESMMLEGAELSAATMKDMLLIRHIEESRDEGDAGLENYIRSNMRRHNALVHMYKAQRLVMPVPFELVKAAQAS